jgi:hypothetical protein
MADANSTRIKTAEPDPSGSYTASGCIEAAEKIAVHWWTILNEAYLHGDLLKSYHGKETGTHSVLRRIATGCPWHVA